MLFAWWRLLILVFRYMFILLGICNVFLIVWFFFANMCLRFQIFKCILISALSFLCFDYYLLWLLISILWLLIVLKLLHLLLGLYSLFMFVFWFLLLICFFKVFFLCSLFVCKIWFLIWCHPLPNVKYNIYFGTQSLRNTPFIDHTLHQFMTLKQTNLTFAIYIPNSSTYSDIWSFSMGTCTSYIMRPVFLLNLSRLPGPSMNFEYPSVPLF